MPRPVVLLTRRPPRRFLAWAALLGLGLGLGSAALIHGLMADPTWWVGLPVGLVLGALVPASVAGGSHVRVADGVLTYGLRGTDCVALPTSAITAVIPVHTGALQGLGLQAPLDALTFVGRKGPTLRTCEAHHAALGCALVLEFFDERDAETLRAACAPEPRP
jgi:hypothetical protein